MGVVPMVSVGFEAKIGRYEWVSRTC
jgi:hypothetical protein